MRQTYSVWLLAGLMLTNLPSAVARAEIPEVLQALPLQYCSAEDGQKPEVKNQGDYGTCWALAATSAMEASLLPEEHLVFSADHMALNNAFAVDLNDGGDYRMAMAYLAGWQGAGAGGRGSIWGCVFTGGTAPGGACTGNATL